MDESTERRPPENAKHVCGSTDTNSGEPCQRRVGHPDAECYDHRGPGAPPGNTNAVGHGAPEGNQNAVANDGGAPIGNTNAIRNGRYTSIKRMFLYFQEQYGEGAADLYKELFLRYKKMYEGTPFAGTGKAEEMAELACISRVLRGELIEDKMETTRYTESGRAYTALDEPRLNEILKLARETRMGISASESGSGSGSASQSGGLDLGILTGESEYNPSDGAH